MFNYYDDSGKLVNVEPIPLKAFVEQINGDADRWHEEYLKYGGLECVHNILPYYEIPQGTKIAEYVAAEKEKMLKNISFGMIEYFCDLNNLYAKKDIKLFWKLMANNIGEVVSPFKLETKFSDENEAGLRNNTIKKYLELMCMNGILNRVKLYDPITKSYKINMSAYCFTDIGIAKALKGSKLKLKALYFSLICNDPDNIEAGITTAKFSKLVRNGDIVSRVYHSVDLLIPANDRKGIAIQILPYYRISESKEAINSISLLEKDYDKVIVTSEDEDTIMKIKSQCSNDIKVIGIDEILRL